MENTRPRPGPNGRPLPSTASHCWAAPAPQPVQVVAEERTVEGSYIGGCVPARDISRYVALYRAGELPVDRSTSCRLRLDEINEGFDSLHEGRAVRQVINFPG